MFGSYSLASVPGCYYWLGLIFIALQHYSEAQVPLPDAKPVPRLQVIPLPNEQVSIQRDGVELTRYQYGLTLKRPFLYPVIGPSGQSLTRLGHPHALSSHSHHNSVWVAHNSVNGDNFWEDSGPGRIVHQWSVQYTDGDNEASIVTINHWVGKDNKVYVVERRGMRVVNLIDGEWLLIVDMQLEPKDASVTLGKTPFGPVAVRMAKTIGVNDGGGLIRNSEGNVNEQGPNGVLWKRARWVDYSGPVLKGVNEGITLFDHPANPRHPSYFHVRNDGWLGASLTFDAPHTIELKQMLRLRYGLYMHRGVPTLESIQKRWEIFAKTTVTDLPNFRK